MPPWDLNCNLWLMSGQAKFLIELSLQINAVEESAAFLPFVVHVETQFDINFFFFVVGSVTILIEQSRKHLNFEPLELLDEWREVKEK